MDKIKEILQNNNIKMLFDGEAVTSDKLIQFMEKYEEIDIINSIQNLDDLKHYLITYTEIEVLD